MEMEKNLNVHNRDYTKPRLNEILSPWQVTGFTDGEGSFTYSLSNNNKNEIKINLEFKVTQKARPSAAEGILLEFKDFFKCGNVVIDNRKTDTKKFQVSSLSNILTKIIPHFENFPCLTSKNLNFLDWKKIAILKSNKDLDKDFFKEEVLNIIKNLICLKNN